MAIFLKTQKNLGGIDEFLFDSAQINVKNGGINKFLFDSARIVD